MTKFVEKFCEVSYDTTSGVLNYIWKEYASTEDTIKSVEKALKIIEKYHIKKILFDAKMAPKFKKDNEDWQVNYFIPSASKKGIKYIAIVLLTPI